MRIEKHANIHNFGCTQNNTSHTKNTFESFSLPDFEHYKSPLTLSLAYASPQINTQYKKLETFKLSNTGEGTVYKLQNGHKIALLPKKGPTIINTYVAAGTGQTLPGKGNCSFA